MVIMRLVKNHAKHLLHCACLTIWLALFSWSGLCGDACPDAATAWIQYSPVITILVVLVKLLSLLALPQCLANLIGMTMYDIGHKKVMLKVPLSSVPLLCVRVVTRGTFPNLVRHTVAQNLHTLIQVGVKKFLIEVVSDCPLNLKGHLDELDGRYLKETVVPPSYKAKSGALNKSRALQYCLDHNELGDDDWIVHLDEETLLTENSVRGICNFTTEDRHPFGQGLITYAQCMVSFKSWCKFLQYRICTVADSFRVCEDLGKMRCQLKLLHRPLFGWKGSYVVCKVRCEKQITFDNGPEGSKAEDAFFAILALDKGYTFDFIEGEMWEKSPFSFVDFFKQRKRWIQGIYLVVTSPRMSLKSRFLLCLSLASWISLPVLTFGNVILARIFPLKLSTVIDLLINSVGAICLYMYALGYLRQHSLRVRSGLKLLLAVPEILLATLLSIIAENCAVMTMWFGDWYDFYIVEKEVKESNYVDQHLV